MAEQRGGVGEAQTLRTFINRVARTPADKFEIGPLLVEMMNYAAATAGARSAYLKRIGGDPGRAIIACSEVGGVIALDGTVSSSNFPVFDEGVQVASLILLRDAPQVPLAREQTDELIGLADAIGLALRRSVMDDEIRRNQQALREAIEAKYQLLGGVSLSLKNTLSVAAGYLELLKMPAEFPEEHPEYADKGRHAIESAVTLINELVELARAEAGDLSMEMETVNLGSFVRAAIENQLGTTSYKRILVNTDISSHLPPVYTDPNQVREILEALLHNAAKYTPEAGVISVRAEVREGRRISDPMSWACVTVQDTGPGVDDPDHIFEEARRVELTRKQVGFRLVICRRIARLLGGDLTVESVRGRGSSFTLWLPLGRRA